MIDAVSKLKDAAGKLPKGLTPGDLYEQSAEQVLNYVEELVNDDAFWAALPEVLVPSASKQEQIAETSRQLAELSGEQIPPDVFADMAAHIRQGENRNELRNYMRQTLDECR